jgi:magnesium chelatase subunit D
MTAERDPAGADAGAAAALFAVDPAGLGGLCVRAPFGPAREIFLNRLKGLLPEAIPVRRLPPGIDDERLLGGLDLAASLAAGRPLAARGLLSEVDGGVLLVPMAERLEPGLAGRLAAALDLQACVVARDGFFSSRPARFGLILLDEGASPEERAPPALKDRVAFVLEADVLEAAAGAPPLLGPDDLVRARALLPEVRAPDSLIEALCVAAVRLGLLSLRAPSFALRAACAHAALHGRRLVAPEDAVAAVRLVLAAHAGVELAAAAEPPAPPGPEETEASPPTEAPAEGQASPPPEAGDPPGPSSLEPQADLLVEAVRAAAPEGVLELAAANRLRGAGARGRGAGPRAASRTRGRPAGSRPGPLARGARLDLVATLKAAAPLQKLRGGGGLGPLRVLKQDFRIRRYLARPETTAVFAVDASGSSALQRLGEVKGAVERLLAEAYVSRTRVALVAFRDRGSSVLLAPTRSLTRAKRSLAELPGGGGTPLGAGIAAALEIAVEERARARTPMIVVLTDGRANVSRDGGLGRAAAEADALAAARLVAASGVECVYVDTSPRPGPDADRFARAMGARYAALPFADAAQISRMVTKLRREGP